MIGMASASSAHKNEGYKNVIGTKLTKKYCLGIPKIIWSMQWLFGRLVLSTHNLDENSPGLGLVYLLKD